MKVVAKFISSVILMALAIGCGGGEGDLSDSKFDSLIPLNYVDESSPTGVSKEFVYLNQDGREVLKSSDIEGLDLSRYNVSITPPLFAPNGLAYFPMLRAYVNTRGEQVLKLSDYDAIEGSAFWEDRALVLSLKKRAYVVIDGKGREIFAIPVDGAEPSTLFNNGYMVLYSQHNGRSQFLDRNGDVALDVDPRKAGYRLCSDLNKYGLIIACKRVGRAFKYGAVNIRGEVVIEFLYDGMGAFDNSGHSIVINGDKHSIINTNGDVLMSVESQYPIRLYGDNIYFIDNGSGVIERYFDGENNEVEASTLKKSAQIGGRYVTTLIDGALSVVRLNDEPHDWRWVVGLFDADGNMISDRAKSYALVYEHVAGGVTYLTVLDRYHYYGRPYTNLAAGGSGVTY